MGRDFCHPTNYMEERMTLENACDHMVRLVRALYRVTASWDSQDTDILERDMRQQAHKILEMIAKGESEYDEADARIMLGYLRIAEEAARVPRENFAVLTREYEKAFAWARERREEYRSRSRMAGEKKQELEQNKGSAVMKSASAPAPVSIAYLPGHTNEHQEHEIGNGRQKEILTRLSRAHELKISDLYSAFPDISSKTIQRDLQDLVIRRIIKKAGEKRWTTYALA